MVGSRVGPVTSSASHGGSTDRLSHAAGGAGGAIVMSAGLRSKAAKACQSFDTQTSDGSLVAHVMTTFKDSDKSGLLTASAATFVSVPSATTVIFSPSLMALASSCVI